MPKPHISYVPLEEMDERMQEEMHRCAREGTPRPESSAVRAHAPNAFWAFADSWKSIFHSGVCDHTIKDLCRVYISRTVKCEFCGNQRSEKAIKAGLEEMQYDDLLNFEKSDTVRRAAEGGAVLRGGDRLGHARRRGGFWARLHANFSEPELVELGCAIALTFGQQSWIRLLGIDHHQYMAGTAASMAPGFRTAEELAASKASPDYWATGAPR